LLFEAREARLESREAPFQSADTQGEIADVAAHFAELLIETAHIDENEIVGFVGHRLDQSGSPCAS
jgi:hypothetical protein